MYAAAARVYAGSGVKTVPLLLGANADIEAFSTGKNTPLYGAIIAEEDSPDYYQAQASTKCREGEFHEDRFKFIEMLLRNEAKVDANASGKQTPLYAAATAYESDRGLVKLLVDKGADPNGNAKGEETPLRHVLDFILLKKRTWEDLKCQAKKSFPGSPDMAAAKCKAAKAKETFDKSIDLAIREVIGPLADWGADPDACTEKEEEKPHSIAKEIGDKKLIKCLNDMAKEFKKRH